MEDLRWECRVCDACGVCGRTEDNCAVYQEFFQIKEWQLGSSDLYSEFTANMTASESAKESKYQQAAGL